MIDNKYKDIINLPHHVSKKHHQMSKEDRAAQFGAFAALTGYDEEIEETGRYTSKKIELNEEQNVILDKKLQIIKNNIKDNPKILCKYFIPDLYKEGGEYKEIAGKVKKIDEYNKLIVLENKSKIYISDIIELKIIIE